ncbi:glycosyltransferase [Streptomyces liangshanensis]|uniref:Glycosyltransferase n=1 Tax=Streptomyces liangshanensis TaxID=2717324 RepID=A0A6G9GUD6_9ACTN|nr:glycosyltransferase [Streptomyces liangshanensis]QIQ01631.1 glycosyltransferase [Streptomyces liangshanensis]
MLRASVVVPVYNAGEHLDRCAASLTTQTLSPDSYEILFVNDGSTDDSADRLHRIASEHAHVRVHHQENSGWPGKPRNVGVALARGAYVQFVDQDDELAPESLERLLALAERNQSDIVLGKVFGTMAGPSNVFKRTVERCTVKDAPLMESLTPHKMFRTSFLREHGITFPEGRVRLEDQLFMARAYVRARTVSILGDYPAYQWVRREDGGNNSGGATTATDYYGHLRAVVRAIHEGTEPGELRDHLLRRSYRVELLRPVTEPRVLQRKGKHLAEYFDVVRRMALECYPPGVRQGLPAVTGLRAALLEEGRLDSLVELATRTRRIKPRVAVEPPVWRDGKLAVRVVVHHVRGDGEPLGLVRRDGDWYLDPELLRGIEGAEDWKVEDPFAYAAGELLLQDTTTGHWWYPDAELTPSLRALGDGRHQVVMEGETLIDPALLSGGEPLAPGHHEVWLNSQMLGVGRRARVASHSRPHVAVGRAGGQVVAPRWAGPHAQLRLTAGGVGARPLTLVRRTLAATASHPGGRRVALRVGRSLPRGARRRARTWASRTHKWSLS